MEKLRLCMIFAITSYSFFFPLSKVGTEIFFLSLSLILLVCSRYLCSKAWEPSPPLPPPRPKRSLLSRLSPAFVEKKENKISCLETRLHFPTTKFQSVPRSEDGGGGVGWLPKTVAPLFFLFLTVLSSCPEDPLLFTPFQRVTRTRKKKPSCFSTQEDLIFFTLSLCPPPVTKLFGKASDRCWVVDGSVDFESGRRPILLFVLRRLWWISVIARMRSGVWSYLIMCQTCALKSRVNFKICFCCCCVTQRLCQHY